MFVKRPTGFVTVRLTEKRRTWK